MELSRGAEKGHESVCIGGYAGSYSNCSGEKGGNVLVG